MGESARGFGGPNPIGGPSKAGEQAQPTYPPAPPPPPQLVDPASGQQPIWPDAPTPAPLGAHGSPPQQPPPPTHPYPGAPQGSYSGPQPSYPAQQWGPGYGLPPVTARRKSRTPLYLGLGAAALVIALVVGAVVIFGGGSGGGGADSPSAAVQQYFEALARGDAEAALALGQSQPPDTTFLTDDLLKRQSEQMPISDIKTLGETPGANGAVMVQVSVRFGDSTTSDKIPVREVDGGWKVPFAALKMDLGRNSGLYKADLFDLVTIFGEPAPKSGVAYVFPGPVELGSSNPNIAITANNIGTPGMMNIFLGLSSQNVQFDVSEEGTAAIRDAIKTKATDCAKSTQLVPPNCLMALDVSGLIDGTAQWTAPASYDGITADFLNPQTGRVQFYGPATFGITVQTDRGRPYQTTTSEYITGEADMTQTPPALTYER